MEHHEGENKLLKNEKKKVGRPRKSEDDQSVRVTVNLPKSLADKLEDYIKITHHSSIPDYIRSSLIFYSAAVNQYEKGGVALLRDINGKDVQLPVTIIPHGS